jgi:hypothetical protein
VNQSTKVRSSVYNEPIDFRMRKEEPGGSVLLLCTNNEEISLVKVSFMSEVIPECSVLMLNIYCAREKLSEEIAL